MSGIKRTPLDDVFSKLVRERADWKCQVCGKDFPERKGSGLHCSHYFGRRGLSTRHHGDNCFSHCYGCHQKLGSRPHEFAAWVRSHLGDTRYDSLVLRANTPTKRPKHELKEMLIHFKAQLEYLKRRRKAGETGIIEFVEWD